jgi:hypothetical protein
MNVPIKLGKRKLSKVNYSHIISVPKVWVENTGLQDNDLVELTWQQEDGSLVVKPAKKEETFQ